MDVRRLGPVAVCVAAILGLSIVNGGVSAASAPLVTVTSSIRYDTSPPLRSMHADPSTVSRIHPVRHASASGSTRAPSSAPNVAPDTSGRSRVVSTNIPSTNADFAGVGNLDGVMPPDSNGAAGPTQYVELINLHLAVYSKTGATVLAPETTNTLWAGFGGGCQTNNDGDGMVIYDAMSGRWVAQQFSVTTLPYLECVAVSTSSDATGTWNRYAFQTPERFPRLPEDGRLAGCLLHDVQPVQRAGHRGTGQ